MKKARHFFRTVCVGFSSANQERPSVLLQKRPQLSLKPARVPQAKREKVQTFPSEANFGNLSGPCGRHTVLRSIIHEVGDQCEAWIGRAVGGLLSFAEDRD